MYSRCIYRLVASAASFLFVLLLSFPSLGMEVVNNAYEGLEKEIVENSGKVAIKEAEEALSSQAKGFVVLLTPFTNRAQSNQCIPAVAVVHPPERIFLRYCVLMI